MGCEELVEYIGCVCLALGGVGGEGVSGLRLALTNPVGTEGVFGVCLCFGCGGVHTH